MCRPLYTQAGFNISCDWLCTAACTALAPSKGSRGGCVGWQPHAAGLLMAQVVQLIAFGFAMILARSLESVGAVRLTEGEGSRGLGVGGLMLAPDFRKRSPSLAFPSATEDSLHYKELLIYTLNAPLDVSQYACSLLGGLKCLCRAHTTKGLQPSRLPAGV